MKECAVNRERAVVANHQMAEVAEPREGTLDFPAPAVASQRSSVLGHRFASIPAMWRDQFDPALRQPLSQRVTVVTTVGDEAQRVLPRSPRAGSAAHADRRERRFRKPRFVRGCRTKVLSQRKTLAVDHHHPLRALAPLGFSDSSAPFLAGAKLPSKKDSLHCSCFRSLSSARNARQILSQTPCSSQSRSLRQQVAGEGNSSGKSCQRAPLRRIHKMPSSTLRSEARGRPPRRREPGRGSKGRIFSHWASVNRRPYRAIGPPAALLTLFISHFRQPNYLRIQALHPVLKQLLVTFDGEGDGVSAAEAEGGDAALEVAALQLIEQRDEDARAARADGMAERHAAAVHVDFFGIEFELACDGDRGHSKCFVQFYEIYVLVAVPAGLGKQLFNRVYRRQQ